MSTPFERDVLTALAEQRKALADILLLLTRADEPRPPVPPGTPVADRYPADYLGRGWKLTLPSGKEILQPELSTFHHDAFALANTGPGARFRVHHGDGTTPGSKNPRCELREMTPDGRTLARWSTTRGRHVLSVTTRVNRLTKVRPHLVLAQIHGEDDDVTVWRLEGTHLWITAGDNTHAHLATKGFPLGAEHTLGFEVAGGHVCYRLGGRLLNYALKVADNACYFKAGAYLQSNASTAPTESTSEYAEVVITAATVTHQP